MEIIGIVNRYTYFTIVRSPRPFILIKVLKTFLKFELPKSQIKSILQYVCLFFSGFDILLFVFSLNRRSSSQIYNVRMFFLFFMSLYAILGVQFFGSLTFHCVRNGTDIK